jgi:hypothetical protein
LPHLCGQGGRRAEIHPRAKAQSLAHWGSGEGQRRGARVVVMIDLQYMAIRYRLGLLNTESLVSIADDLIKEERDTPATIHLAILEPPIMADAAPIFERMCDELGVVVPNKEQAFDELLRFHLISIASGSRDPRAGLHDMMQEVYFPHIINEPVKKYVGDSRGLEHLISSYWSYDDLRERSKVSFQGKHEQAAIQLFDEHVRQLAKDWLQKNSS